jgi:hypothetical protein
VGYLVEYSPRQIGGYRVRVIVLNKAGARQQGYNITFYGGPHGTGEVLDTQTTGVDGVADDQTIEYVIE